MKSNIKNATLVEKYRSQQAYPIEMWFKLQTFDKSHNACDAVVALYDLQQAYAVHDRVVQKRMLGSLQQSRPWNTSFMTSWQQLADFLDTLPNWGTDLKLCVSQFLSTTFKSVPISQYAALHRVQEVLDSGWNALRTSIQVSSKIPTLGTAFEQYETLRFEFLNKKLLEHKPNLFWKSAQALGQTPQAWKDVLIPLYSKRLLSIADTNTLLLTTLEEWIRTLDGLGLDASLFPIPNALGAYNCNFDLPDSWFKECTSEDAYRKINYICNAPTKFILKDMSALIVAVCENHSESWSFSERIEFMPMFLKATVDSYVFDFRNLDCNVDLMFKRWFPEWVEAIEIIQSTHKVLGLDFKEIIYIPEIQGERRFYTKDSLSREIDAYYCALSSKDVALIEHSHDLFLGDF